MTLPLGGLVRLGAVLAKRAPLPNVLFDGPQGEESFDLIELEMSTAPSRTRPLRAEGKQHRSVKQIFVGWSFKKRHQALIKVERTANFAFNMG